MAKDVWTESNLTTLFMLSKVYLSDPIYQKNDSAREIFRYDLSEKEYQNALNNIFKVLCDTTDAAKPKSSDAVHMQLFNTFLTTEVDDNTKLRMAFRNRAIAYKVGYLPFELMTELNNLILKKK